MARTYDLRITKKASLSLNVQLKYLKLKEKIEEKELLILKIFAILTVSKIRIWINVKSWIRIRFKSFWIRHIVMTLT